MNKELRKNLPTALVGAGAVLGITGVVTSWFGAKKAAKEMAELDPDDPKFKQRKMLIVVKHAAIPAACIVAATGCNIAANEMNIQTITTMASLAVAAEAKAEKHEQKIKQVLKDKLKIEDEETEKMVAEAKKEADKELMDEIKVGKVNDVVVGHKTLHNNTIIFDQCSGWTGWGNVADVQEAYAEALRECMPEEDWKVYGDGYMNPVKKHTLEKSRWLEILEKHLDNFYYGGGHGDDSLGWNDVKNEFVITLENSVATFADESAPVVDICYSYDAYPYSSWD